MNTTITQTTAARELQEAQEKVADVQQQIARYQDEARALADQIAAIDQRANEQKVLLAGGGAGASATLDALERERLALDRKRQGIVLAIAGLDQQLKPLISRTAELAHVLDIERQDFEVKRVTGKMRRLADEIFDHWREGCRSAFSLMKEVESIAGNQLNLDEEHRRLILHCLEQVNSRAVFESAAHVNENWRMAPNRLPELRIMPACPPPRVPKVR
jgi:hypothetical protein